MLGKTANGLTWMSRYIERAENTARKIEAGMRMAMVSAASAPTEWIAVVNASGVAGAYAARRGQDASAASVVDFLLRDPGNPSSALVALEAARTNARMVRTAITREVWEAINDAWLDMREALATPVDERELPAMLERLRRHGALVRGALYGTMLRNEIFDFIRIGTYLERADNTARLLDVKYHVLLPSTADVGGPLDVLQWEQLLRAVHVNRAYMMECGADYRADLVTEFLMLNPRMPRSLRFCASRISEHLDHLADEYGERTPACEQAAAMRDRLDAMTVESIFADGLHEVLADHLAQNAELAEGIARAYRFVE